MPTVLKLHYVLVLMYTKYICMVSVCSPHGDVAFINTFPHST